MHRTRRLNGNCIDDGADHQPPHWFSALCNPCSLGRVALLLDDPYLVANANAGYCGLGYFHLLFVTAGPLLLFLSWTFLAPQGTEGSAEAAKSQYFEKAPQAFSLLAVIAVWAIVLNLWLVGGAAALSAGIGWGVMLVLFIVITRSSNPRLHGGVVAFAWVLLIAEYIFELMRGVPTL